MEGLNARQEACLIHSALKWVDEDDNPNLTENQNFDSISNNISRRYLTEDELNANTDSKNLGIAMVNEIAEISDVVDNANGGTESDVFRSECNAYSLLLVILRPLDNSNF